MTPLLAQILEDLTLRDPIAYRRIILTASTLVFALTILVLAAAHLRRKGPDYLRRFLAWKNRPRPVQDPHKQALASLRTLEASASSAEPRPFAGQVAQILRVYLEQRFGLHATRQASEECLREAAGHGPLAPEILDALTAILHTADFDKFSPIEAEKANRDLLEKARNFIERTAGSGVIPPDYDNLVEEIFGETAA